MEAGNVVEFEVARIDNGEFIPANGVEELTESGSHAKALPLYIFPRETVLSSRSL